MALTPEQVLNKHFQTTQFRRGYEERDVDDFLDEVVAEMRSLIEQRDDYLKQLNDCRASKNQPAIRSDGTPPAQTADEARLGGLQAKIQEAERAFKAASERAAKAKAEVENAERAAKERIERANTQARRAEESSQAPGAPGGQTTAEPNVDAATATTGAGSHTDEAAEVIALAQRLHDEHVRNGESKRDELIAAGRQRHDELVSTGQGQHDEAVRIAEETSTAAAAERDQMLATATSQRDEMLATAKAKRDELLAAATARRDEMLTEARERSTGMVAEAQQKRAAVLEELDRQKGMLSRKIDELRAFERDYRTNLKAYMTRQLADLDRTSEEHSAPGGGEGQRA